MTGTSTSRTSARIGGASPDCAASRDDNTPEQSSRAATGNKRDQTVNRQLTTKTPLFSPSPAPGRGRTPRLNAISLLRRYGGRPEVQRASSNATKQTQSLPNEPNSSSHHSHQP